MRVLVGKTKMLRAAANGGSSRRFAKLTRDHVEKFRHILPSPSCIIYNEHGSAGTGDVEKYNIDWMRKYRGNSSLVLKPTTPREVADVLKFCNDQQLAIVPQGGNTGLVGGSIPVLDEIILSLEKLNRVRSFDPVAGKFLPSPFQLTFLKVW
jgi:hypothetical protein